MYSVVTTTEANGLNPRKYVQWLLEETPNAADPDDPAYRLRLFLVTHSSTG